MKQTLSMPRNSLTTLRYLIAVLILLATTAAYYITSTQPAAAITPPDSCFAFNAGTGTITNYYNHEANNPANPACPRAVDIPSTIGGVAVTAIGAASNYWSPATATSFASKSLTSVTIPNSVTTIGNYAFYSNQLTTVTIPNSVTTIGNDAFSNNQLTSVTIPNSVTTIGNYAFYSNQLTTVTITGNPTTIGTEILYRNPVETISYNGTTYTDATANHESCFVFNAGTGTITNFRHADPAFIKSNGQACLDRDVTIPSTIGGIAVTTIGTSAFYYNQLTSVTIPNSVTTIGNTAFYDNQLTSVTIGNSVTTIGDYAFGLNNLTSVTLGSSVTSIGAQAFYGNQLTAVTIPSSVTSIGKGAFIIQSQYGPDLEKDNGIGPYIWSDDPAEIQAAYEEIWYVSLYTEDPSNPNNLTDGVVSESDWWGGDENEDGEDDSFGGHLINPASAELSYKNASGTQLQSPLTSVGQLPSGERITTYYADQGPRLFNTNNPTPEEVESTRQALTAYHRLGDSVTFTPPSIAGYQTPAPTTLTLSQPTTEHSFVYIANTSTPANPTTPPTPAPKYTGAPKLNKVTWHGASSATGTMTARPMLFGLFNSTSTSRLAITFANTTYILGEDPELTAAGDTWTLDLTSITEDFTPGEYTITIQSTDDTDTTTTTTETLNITEQDMLAETGESVAYIVAGAVLLLVVGGLFFRVGHTSTH